MSWQREIYQPLLVQIIQVLQVLVRKFALKITLYHHGSSSSHHDSSSCSPEGSQDDPVYSSEAIYVGTCLNDADAVINEDQSTSNADHVIIEDVNETNGVDAESESG